MNKQGYVSIGKASLLLDVSSSTLKRWYQFYESEEYEKPKGLKLPEYQYFDKTRTKYFAISDLPKLKKFKQQINSGEFYGCMSEFNKKIRGEK